MEDPLPLVRFRTFLEYPLSPPPTERTYLLNGPKKLSIFISILCLTYIKMTGLYIRNLNCYTPKTVVFFLCNFTLIVSRYYCSNIVFYIF